MYTITHNPAFGSLEVTFDTVPSAAVRAELKNRRFRWHTLRKLWYGYSDEENLRAALDKLTARAERIAAANRARRAAKAPEPETAPEPDPIPEPELPSPQPETAPDPIPEPERPLFEDPAPRIFRPSDTVTLHYSTGTMTLTLRLVGDTKLANLGKIIRLVRDVSDKDERREIYDTVQSYLFGLQKTNPRKKSHYTMWANNRDRMLAYTA